MVHKQRLCVLHFKTAARIEALMDGFFGRRQCGFVGHGEATTVFFGHGVNDFFLGDSIKRLKDLMDNSSMEQEYRDKFPKFGMCRRLQILDWYTSRDGDCGPSVLQLRPLGTALTHLFEIS